MSFGATRLKRHIVSTPEAMPRNAACPSRWNRSHAARDCRDDDCPAVHRAAFESVVEVFAVGGRAADHRGVLGAKAARMPDRGAGPAAVDARDERPQVIAVARRYAQAADVDEQVLATQPDLGGNARLRQRCSRGYEPFRDRLDAGGRIHPNDSTHRLDAGVLEDFAHPVCKLVIEFRELRGILISVLELVVLDVLLPGRRARQPAEKVLPELDVFPRNPRRRNHAANLWHDRHIEAGLLERWDFGKFRKPLFAHLREHAQVAGADVFARLFGLDHHDVDVASEQRGDALAPARKRYEDPARARGLLQELPHDIVAARIRAAGLLELPGILL